jgi:hypothetical protein
MPGEESASDSGKNKNGRSSQNAKNNTSGSSPGANRSSAISTSRRPTFTPALPPRPAAALKAEELRVALQELGSGDTSGRAFVRLPSATAAAAARAAGGIHRCSGDLSGSPAPAAAALLTDREAARARVSRQLRELVEEDFAPPGKHQ